jgi:hypothetical protein
LITKMNRPSVSTVTGRVRSTRSGRIRAFTRPSTSAATRAAPALAMVTDGMK